MSCCLAFPTAQRGSLKVKGERKSSGPPAQVLSRKELCLPWGQRIGNKRQRQEVEDEGEGEGNQGQGYLSPGEDKGLPLDREKTDVADRKPAAYKSTKGNARCVRMRCLILINRVN